MALGGGEHRALTKNKTANGKTIMAQTVVGDFDVFDF
jgi:hypothetical protein